MGFWTLFEVASMPMLQVLIIATLGAFMATNYLKLLPEHALSSLNKIVFVVFTPSLMFSSLASTVKLEDMISWWFMPINIALTFLFGGILGLIAVKTLKMKPHLEGLFIATCSAGNMGNIFWILVPAICKEDASPFGDHKVCTAVGLSYSSFSMAIGGLFIWSSSYQLVKSSATKGKALKEAEAAAMIPNKDLDANGKTHLLEGAIQENISVVSINGDTESQSVLISKEKVTLRGKLMELLHQIGDVFMEPPTIAAVAGFIFGATTFLRNLIIGESAPLRVIQDSLKLLGDGTIPCSTLILGGNLKKGLQKADLKPMMVISLLVVRFVILPIIGIGVVKAADHFGFLPHDPLYHFILMVQFTVPPAMAIGTMSQLFDAGQAECSILFLWTYLVAAIAMTAWSTVFMWILSS